MMRPCAVIVASLITLACSAALAQEAGGQEGRFSLTIYSTADPGLFSPQQFAQQARANPYYAQQYKLPGYGVVREIRPLTLKEGINTIRFSDVASWIDPTTVAFESLTSPAGTSVLEQNYEYDLVSANKLLEKYLDKIVTVRFKSGADGAQPAQDLSGTLLSSDGANLVLQTEAGEILVLGRQDVSGIRLAKQETSLITKPTLVWTIDTDTAGEHDARVTYQTDGLTWRADYNLLINPTDTAVDVSAWVSIVNESGASYPSTKLKLVAGDVQRIQPPDNQNRYGFRARSEFAAAKESTGFVEKSFFEYHLYTLGRETSLPDKSTKQIELFDPKKNVPVTKTFVYYGLPETIRYYITPQPNQDRDLGTQSNKKVDIYLLIKNAEANGLGIPLPAGRIRVYKQDEADGSNEFIGEDTISHTPKDEEFMVKLGSAFDIVGERRQTDFKVDYNARWITESFEIVLRNHKDEPARVIVKENLFRWVNWEITAKSDEFEKQDFRTVHFPVDVPANGEKKVTYTVKYTW